jgi:hypothetical protein
VVALSKRESIQPRFPKQNPLEPVIPGLEARAIDKMIQDDYTIQNYLKGLGILNAKEKSNDR